MRSTSFPACRSCPFVRSWALSSRTGEAVSTTHRKSLIFEIPEDRVAADIPEVQAVVPPAWVLIVLRLTDSNVNDVAGFDILPVCNCRVGRHPLPYGIASIGIILWTRSHRLTSRYTGLPPGYW